MILTKGWLAIVLATGLLGGCSLIGLGGGSSCAGWSVKTPTGTSCSSTLPPAQTTAPAAAPAAH